MCFLRHHHVGWQWIQPMEGSLLLKIHHVEMFYIVLPSRQRGLAMNLMYQQSKLSLYPSPCFSQGAELLPECRTSPSANPAHQKLAPFHSSEVRTPCKPCIFGRPVQTLMERCCALTLRIQTRDLRGPNPTPTKRSGPRILRANPNGTRVGWLIANISIKSIYLILSQSPGQEWQQTRVSQILLDFLSIFSLSIPSDSLTWKWTTDPLEHAVPNRVEPPHFHHVMNPLPSVLFTSVHICAM